MTETEFRAAVRPLLARYPTEDRKLAFRAIVTVASSNNSTPRLIEIAREELYKAHPDRTDQNDNVIPFSRH